MFELLHEVDERRHETQADEVNDVLNISPEKNNCETEQGLYPFSRRWDLVAGYTIDIYWCKHHVNIILFLRETTKCTRLARANILELTIR